MIKNIWNHWLTWSLVAAVNFFFFNNSVQNGETLWAFLAGIGSFASAYASVMAFAHNQEQMGEQTETDE